MFNFGCTLHTTKARLSKQDDITGYTKDNRLGLLLLFHYITVHSGLSQDHSHLLIVDINFKRLIIITQCQSQIYIYHFTSKIYVKKVKIALFFCCFHYRKASAFSPPSYSAWTNLMKHFCYWVWDDLQNSVLHICTGSSPVLGLLSKAALAPVDFLCLGSGCTGESPCTQAGSC